MVWRRNIVLFMLIAVTSVAAMAQQTDKSLIRSGNRKFKNEKIYDAEVSYRKAIEKNPNSATGNYNLGTVLMHQKDKTDYESALEYLSHAAKLEKDKDKLSDIYHNIGVAYQSQKKLKECIEAYKRSLINNPHNDETRYNLVLAQKQLKEQEKQNNKDQQDNQDKEKNQQKQDKKDEQKKNQNQQQQQQQKNQNNMSKDAAQQLLNSIMQDERNVQDKVKKGMQVGGKKLDKDW